MAYMVNYITNNGATNLYADSLLEANKIFHNIRDLEDTSSAVESIKIIDATTGEIHASYEYFCSVNSGVLMNGYKSATLMHELNKLF